MMDNTTKLLINHIFAHLMLIPGVIYGELWMWIAGFLWWQVIAIVSISGGYHRYYSHFSFKAPNWYPYVVNFLGIFAGAGPAMTWAAVHRQHHAYSDTEDDPHSHHVKGWFPVYVNTWGWGFQIKRRFIKRLMQDSILRWFYNNYFRLNIAIIFVLAAIDPLLMIFGYALPVVLAFHGYGLLNILGHRDGQPNNSWVANILTAGEGWHANHHKRGGDYRIGWTKWQFDPTAKFIELIRR
jgi:stearoyl-CoA desaturase (delta-9 desaturase)